MRLVRARTHLSTAATICAPPKQRRSSPRRRPQGPGSWEGRSDAFARVGNHVAALIGARAGAAVIPLRGCWIAAEIGADDNR